MTVSTSDLATPYLEMATRLANGRVAAEQLPNHISHLPPLSRELLNHLATLADEISPVRPQYSWAIMAVADAVAARLSDAPFLSARAAWHLARAANAWTRPQRAAEAAHRARAGFDALDVPGWLAACDWQLYALPWTRPNFKQAASELDRALTTLTQIGWDDFAAACRLSLAYARLLIGEFDRAAEEIARSEQYYLAREDQLGQGKCLLHKASYLRRQSDFDEAMCCLQEAMALFQATEAMVYIGMTRFQLALVNWLLKGDFQTAENEFKQAMAVFEKTDLTLWLGQCYGGLAQIYNNLGRLGAAGKALRETREIYGRFQVQGLQADSLLDSAELELYRGNYTASLDYLVRARELYQQIGNQWLPAVATRMQGEVNLQLGRYHLALHYLEQAEIQFRTLNMPHREAQCATILARAWTRLSRFAQAHTCLNAAMSYYRQANQTLALPELYNLKAGIFFAEGRDEEGIDALQQALMAAQEQANQPQIALAERLLGEALAASGEEKKARRYLQAAEEKFRAMELVTEQAVCQVAWGGYHAGLGDGEAATEAWRAALALSQGVMPDIAWQAYAGLAQQAAARGNDDAALAQYRQAVQTLARVRQGLWQPSLTGSYLSRSAAMLDRTVALAVRLGASRDALNFIEENKATIAARQIRAEDRLLVEEGGESTALRDLAAEVRWLQEKIRVDFQDAQHWLRPAEERALRRQLTQQVKAYARLKERVERRSPQKRPFPEVNFDLDQFRRLAEAKLAGKWLALDYHLTAERLYTVLVTADTCTAWSTPVTRAMQVALHLADRQGPIGPTLASRDLAVLGSWLLPEPVRPLLDADPVLLISPHSQLHRLPWAILQIAEGQPLVTVCKPAITPSLQGVAAIWQRPFPERLPLEAGLLTAVADFQGRHPPLPAVEVEADTLAAHCAAEEADAGFQLREEEATWDNLHRLSRLNGLSRFSCWHIASHAFHDPVSGRLSGLALYDRDVWLDELWELAPLPPLVVLSACNGSQSLVYEGDEHVGLAITCLAAGAQSFVGSLWPVLDVFPARLMSDFYQHLAAGQPVAQALAAAQRAAWRRQDPASQWGGFCCTGRP